MIALLLHVIGLEIVDIMQDDGAFAAKARPDTKTGPNGPVKTPA
ncbi:hypothetical protein [Rhizobium sp.]